MKPFYFIFSMFFLIQVTALEYKAIETSQGSISYIDTEGSGFPVVLIHGNSCSSEVFKKEIAAFQDRYRMIAIDLPGHGRSSLPNDPETAYTIPGYAELLDEVVGYLGLSQFAVVGYSMGGNIALQWSQISKGIQGIMMVSSAPMKYSEEAMEAYPPCEGSFTAWPQPLTELQAKTFMKACGFSVEDPSVYFTVEDAMKTDGKSRENMVKSVLEGRGSDETEIVSSLPLPLAVVAGSEDSFLGHGYIQGLHYRNLWRGEVQEIEYAKHSLIFHDSERLFPLLDKFLKEINGAHFPMSKKTSVLLYRFE